MRQGVNLGHIPTTRLLLSLRFDVAKTGKGVLSIDIHGARSADPLAAGTTEGQCRVLLRFDFD